MPMPLDYAAAFAADYSLSPAILMMMLIDIAA